LKTVIDPPDGFNSFPTLWGILPDGMHRCIDLNQILRFFYPVPTGRGPGSEKKGGKKETDMILSPPF
jgi:hypothetical protein